MPQSRSYRKIAAALVVLTLFVFSVGAVSAGAAGAQPSDDRLITAEGAGAAVLGLTADELAEALGPDYDLGDEVRITVDFDGRVVTRDGQVQFRAAMTAGTDQLTLFIISDPAYMTAEGVGATTMIADAEAAYGDATLSWNPDNESREFVSFENGPEGRIAFRTPGIGGNNVGIYADGAFETNDYESGSAIAAVWVSCIPGTDCPADRATAEPTAEPEATPVPGSGGSDETAETSDLPQTGATELVLLSAVSLLFVIGGGFVLIERRFLIPSWLNGRR